MEKEPDHVGKTNSPENTASGEAGAASIAASHKVLSELQSTKVTHFPGTNMDMEVQASHHKSWLGLGDTDVLETDRVSLINQDTGERTTIPANFRLERSGDEQHQQIEYIDLNMDIYANRRTRELQIQLNDDNFSLHGNGDFDVSMGDHKVHLAADGSYSEEHQNGSRVVVSRMGRVTTVDSNGHVDHFRLDVQGDQGARLESFHHDSKTGNLVADFSDGTQRTLQSDYKNHITSSWITEEKDSSGGTHETYHYEAIKADAFASKHLMTRLYLENAIPKEPERSSIFNWPDSPVE